MREPVIYRTASGFEPYTNYVDRLRDRDGAAKIQARAQRAALGNLGHHRSVGRGVIELKIDFGPGYRLYIGLRGSEIVVLLCVGDKGTQRQDIRAAHEYWNDYRRNS